MERRGLRLKCFPSRSYQSPRLGDIFNEARPIGIDEAWRQDLVSRGQPTPQPVDTSILHDLDVKANPPRGLVSHGHGHGHIDVPVIEI